MTDQLLLIVPTYAEFGLLASHGCTNNYFKLNMVVYVGIS